MLTFAILFVVVTLALILFTHFQPVKMISLEKLLFYVRVQCFHKIPRYFLLGSGDCLSYLIVQETCRHKKTQKKGGSVQKRCLDSGSMKNQTLIPYEVFGSLFIHKKGGKARTWRRFCKHRAVLMQKQGNHMTHGLGYGMVEGFLNNLQMGDIGSQTRFLVLLCMHLCISRTLSFCSHFNPSF